MKLCHINRSGPVFLRHSVDVISEARRTVVPSIPFQSDSA